MFPSIALTAVGVTRWRNVKNATVCQTCLIFLDNVLEFFLLLLLRITVNTVVFLKIIEIIIKYRITSFIDR